MCFSIAFLYSMSSFSGVLDCLPTHWKKEETEGSFFCQDVLKYGRLYHEVLTMTNIL